MTNVTMLLSNKIKKKKKKKKNRNSHGHGHGYIQTSYTSVTSKNKKVFSACVMPGSHLGSQH